MNVKPIVKKTAVVLLVAAAALSFWALSKCVGATSITITDACPNYSVNNAGGVLSIACATTPPPPPVTLPGNDVSCAGFTNTLNMQFDYVPGTGQKVQTTQGMSTTDVLVVRFTTPATIAGGTGAGGTLQITDNAQNSSGFVGSLSTTPCTFTSNVKSGLLSASWGFSNYPLKPNTQFFVNIKGDSALSVKLLAR